MPDIDSLIIERNTLRTMLDQVEDKRDEYVTALAHVRQMVLDCCKQDRTHTDTLDAILAKCNEALGL